MRARWWLWAWLFVSTATGAHPFDPFAEDKKSALELVLTHLREGDNGEALLQVDDAIAKFPQHGPFYALKGQILLRQNRVAEALPTVNRALELTPDYALAYWLRGLIYQRQGAFAAALADFERTLKTDEDNLPLKIQATGSRGTVLVDLGRYREAVEALDRAIEARPQAFAERQSRALAHLRLGNLPAAARDIDELANASDDTFTRKLQAELYLRRGDAKRALPLLDAAIKANPRDAHAHALRAEAHNALKDSRSAARDAAHACKLGAAAACTPRPTK